MNAIFLFIFPALAYLPANLEYVDSYLGQPNWKNNFERPQTVNAVFLEESGQTTKSEYLTKSEMVSPDTVKILNLDQHGKEISSFNFQKSSWESQHGNWIRIFVSQTESYGYKMTIDEVTPIQM